tara:strand:- start:3878 stop:4144 length:267 start_codon:yes stop_codon:yes gene_type:complete
MNVNDLYNAQFGGGNPIFIDDSNVEHTGPFYAFTVVGTTAAVIDSSGCTTNIVDAAPTMSFPLGSTIYGDFTSIELNSGAIIAYYKPQ